MSGGVHSAVGSVGRATEAAHARPATSQGRGSRTRRALSALGRSDRRRRGLLVVNPAAGRVSRALVDAVAERCGRWLDELSATWTSRPGAGVEAVASAVTAAERAGRPLDVAVAVGGDATVREVAEGLARGLGRWPVGDAPEGAPRLLVVPGGRGNSAYRAIWGDRAWEDVARAALSGEGSRIRRLDLLRIVDGDRAVLLGVNAGLVARIVRLAAEGQGHGLERYYAAVGAALQDLRPFPGRVTVDGATVYAGVVNQVTVGGVRRFGAGSLELLPRSVLDDGLLDVCIIGDLSGDGVAELAALVPTGQHLGRPNVTYGRGSQIVVERSDGHALEVEHDGDAWWGAGATVTLEVVPRAVPAFAPVDAPDG